eukprot:31858_2
MEPLRVKITDFGFARAKAVNQTMTKCGTKAWIAPETLQGKRYDEKSDVFSYGIVAWEVTTRNHPYGDLDPLRVGFEVVRGKRPSIPR